MWRFKIIQFKQRHLVVIDQDFAQSDKVYGSYKPKRTFLVVEIQENNRLWIYSAGVNFIPSLASFGECSGSEKIWGPNTLPVVSHFLQQDLHQYFKSKTVSWQTCVVSRSPSMNMMYLIIFKCCVSGLFRLILLNLWNPNRGSHRNKICPRNQLDPPKPPR